MIKAVGTVEDDTGTRPSLIIGLTRADVDNLLGGKSARFECAQIGLSPMQVIVTFGEDDQAIVATIPGASVAVYDGAPRLL